MKKAMHAGKGRAARAPGQLPPPPYRTLPYGARCEIAQETARLRSFLPLWLGHLEGYAVCRERLKSVAPGDQAGAKAVWHGFIAQSWRARGHLHKALGAVTRLVTLLKSLNVKLREPGPAELHPKAFLDLFPASVASPQRLRRLIPRLHVTRRKLTLESARDDLAAASKFLGNRIRDKMNRVGSAEEALHHIELAIHDDEDDGGGEIPCSTSEFILLVCVVVAVVLIILLIKDFVEEAETDEAPRRWFNNAPCEELAAAPLDRLVEAIDDLCRGPTLDGDEQAILRLFRCLPCIRVRELWEASSPREEDGRIGTRLLFDFDGAEWDRLVIRLQECGVLRFSDFDDDATRRFIRQNDCAVLGRLSNADIRRLILNLFAGSTGDEDERAIYTLIECLSCGRVAELMRMRGLSYDDFYDEVDGSEWTRLRRSLEAARVCWG
jgi:hypothetical protein